MAYFLSDAKLINFDEVELYVMILYGVSLISREGLVQSESGAFFFSFALFKIIEVFIPTIFFVPIVQHCTLMSLPCIV